MDIESLRRKKVRCFVESIGLTYCTKWKEFVQKLGVQVTEELKLLSEKEWDQLKNSLNMSIVQHRKLDAATHSLMSTGPADPTINKPLPLKPDNPHQRTEKQSSQEKPKTNNKRKSGNINIMNCCKKKSDKKQVVDVTAQSTKKDALPMLTIQNDIDWRAARAPNDNRVNLNKLLDPASQHERDLWKIADLEDVNLEDLPDRPASSNNFEDYLGFYNLLGNSLNRKSTPDEIEQMLRSKKSKFRKDTLAAHPDQNNGVDKGSQEINEKWREVENIYKSFIQQNECGMSGRLLYDCECDKLTIAWRRHIKYDDEGAREEFKRMNKMKKRKETMDNAARMTNIERCVALHSTNGAQSNEWKFAVSNSINEDKKTKNEIARAIRIKRGSSNWDGKTSDQHFQRIKQCVNRAMQALANKNFNINYFNDLSAQDSKSILKKKRAVCIPSSEINIKRVGKRQNELEEDIMTHIADLWDKKKRVSRLLVFRCVRNKYPWFKGGPAEKNYFKDVKTWFCNGFVKRRKLSYTRIAGASRKLPSDWKEKVQNIIERVARSQQCKRVGNNAVPPTLDHYFVNTDHIPFYRDMVGMYSWTKQGAGGKNKREFRGQVGTGGGDKDRFTVQLSVTKSGKKLKPYLIFKGAAFNGAREYRRNTVAYELLNRLDDKYGNSYPPEEKMHLTCNETGNSNGTLTKDILEKVIFPFIKVQEGNRGGAC